jgi:hypothetical protein
MKGRDDLVFLLDCDNTLLDNDRVQDDLRAHPAPGTLRARPQQHLAYPSADLTVERIGDLIQCDLPALLGDARADGMQ